MMNVVLIILIVACIIIPFIILIVAIILQIHLKTKTITTDVVDVNSSEYEHQVYAWVLEQTQKTTTKIQN